MSDRVEFTESQAKAWPEAVAEVQRYVDTSAVPEALFGWTVQWDEELRPGRGHSFTGIWSDGEYFAQVLMDVYGYPSVSVAELGWLHSSSYEECGCEPCKASAALAPEPTNYPGNATIEQSQADVSRLVAAIEAVGGLHQPQEEDQLWCILDEECEDCYPESGDGTGHAMTVCSECRAKVDDVTGFIPWPCPTITAVVAALGGGE